jgi:hypothetical protein
MKTVENLRQQMPIHYEPKRTNRWIIKFVGQDENANLVGLEQFPYYLFQTYKLYNDKDIIKLDISLFEVIHTNIHPDDFFKIIEIHIMHIDPVGDTIGTLKFRVKTMNFETVGDYGDDSLLTHKLYTAVEFIK